MEMPKIFFRFDLKNIFTAQIKSQSANFKIDINNPFSLNLHFLVKSFAESKHCVRCIIYIEVLK